jgi:hypothetical protein
MPHADHPRRIGLARFEAALVLLLLVLGLGLLLPWLRQARAAEDEASCKNNLKQLVLATHNMNDSYGKLPPVVGAFPNAQGSASTLFFQMLPFIEYQQVFNQGTDGGAFSPWVGSVYSTSIPVYLCPDDKSGPPKHLYQGWLATSSYAANYLIFGLIDGGSARLSATIPDGTSNTIGFAERYQMCDGRPNSWAYTAHTSWAPMFAYQSADRYQINPRPQECDPTLAQGPHAKGMYVGMMDGTVKLLPARLSEATWRDACGPNDGHELGKDWPKENAP